jgi:hypothetical protein
MPDCQPAEITFMVLIGTSHDREPLFRAPGLFIGSPLSLPPRGLLF